MKIRLIKPDRLTDRLFVSQIIILLLILFIVISITLRMNYVSGEDANVDKIAAAIRIDSRHAIQAVNGLTDVIDTDSAKNRWVMMKVRGGAAKAFGPVPALARYVAENDIDIRDMTWERDGRQFIARAKLVRIDKHNVQIIAPRGGEAHLSRATEMALILVISGSALVLLVISIVGLTTTLGAIRRSVSALRRTTEQAQAISPTGATTALSLKDLPLDVHPLVETINTTLAKLQKAYTNQGTFLRDAAHELRTPIAVLSLRVNDLPPGEMRSTIKGDIARLASVADQLLDLQRAKEQDGSPVTVDINAAASRTLSDLAPFAIEAGYQVVFEEEGAPLRISGDPVSIERILTNLIQNAIRYGGGRGTITVRVSGAGYLEVGDEGPGIAPDVRDRIFDPFFRGDRSRQGTGLGLYLVRQMAEMHGARVSVEPGPKPGAWLRIRFPISA